MKVGTAVAGATVIAGAVVAVFLWRSPVPPARPAPADDVVAPVAAVPVPSTPPARPAAAPAPVVEPARRVEPAPMTEPQLMATLRELGGTAPQRSIDLAREGQRRFPNSADAAERDFIVTQSLVNLKRFHEAQDEARAMVRKYPDNQFALDAQRHLLVYPLDQPSREEMQEQMRRDQ